MCVRHDNPSVKGQRSIESLRLVGMLSHTRSGMQLDLNLEKICWVPGSLRKLAKQVYIACQTMDKTCIRGRILELLIMGLHV